MKRVRVAAIGLLTSAFLTVAVAAAGGTAKQKPLVFTVEVKGSQTLTWAIDEKVPHAGSMCLGRGGVERGFQSWIVPVRGSGRFRYTFAGRKRKVQGPVRGRIGLGTVHLKAPTRGTIEGEYGIYWKSEGHWDPYNICGWDPPLGEDVIDPTDECGAFTAMGSFEVWWQAGKLNLHAGWRRLYEGDCALDLQWQLKPAILYESSVPLSAKDLGSGETISRTKTTTAAFSESTRGMHRGQASNTWTVTLIPGKGLHAVPEASPALRGGVAKLDGSKSTGDIVSYVWRFKAADGCGDVHTRAGARKRGKRVSIKPLCPVNATLTVSDGRHTDSATVTVPVTPRTNAWTMPPVKHEDVLRDARVSDPPFVNSASGITLGENVAACDAGSLGPPMLCPPARGGTGLGDRYTLAAVHDRGGPFDGYSYVATAPLTVERLGILNYWFLPGAPAFVLNQANFWDYNQSHPVLVGGAPQNVDLQGLRIAMSAHEGMGRPGRLATGHSGRLQAWLWDEEGDPRRALESMFGPRKGTLQSKIDHELATDSSALSLATKDPLPVIWQGQVWLYDRENSVWRQEELTVGG